MVTVVALLLAITALGVVGLASFNVNQRRKQIGTRRALGATRFNIIRYFLVENVLITSGGIALGLVLSILVNILIQICLKYFSTNWKSPNQTIF